MYRAAAAHTHGPPALAHPWASIESSFSKWFALAAAGQRRESRTWSRRALRARRTNLRAWLALAVSFRLIGADVIARTANRFGKGI